MLFGWDGRLEISNHDAERLTENVVGKRNGRKLEFSKEHKKVNQGKILYN